MKRKVGKLVQPTLPKWKSLSWAQNQKPLAY